MKCQVCGSKPIVMSAGEAVRIRCYDCGFYGSPEEMEQAGIHESTKLQKEIERHTIIEPWMVQLKVAVQAGYYKE